VQFWLYGAAKCDQLRGIALNDAIASMPGGSLTTRAKVRDQELLVRLRALGSKAGGAGRAAGVEDAVGRLGLPEQELTPKVRSALRRLIAEVGELRRELTTTQGRLAELERLADEDSLAPISNRRAFLRSLARTIGYVGRYRAKCSLLYFDVNGLKSINDGHGHAAGDAALIHVAGVLRAHSRASDVVGRLGGDEFGVLLTRANETHAASKALHLARTIERTPLVWEGRRIAISVACGAHALTPGEDPREALAAADRAMYRQKRAAGGPPGGCGTQQSLRR
jgi:diguanylate cyclase (GGDEF)-like protein